jgi:HK97 gp10 family phage protein
MSEFLKLTGFDGLEKALKELPDEVARKVAEQSLRKGARIIADEMKARAPVRQDGRVKKMGKNAKTGRLPGYLRASIGVRIKRGLDAALATLAVGIGPNRRAYYASFLEFGTRHEPARPFARPALDAKGDEAVQAIGADMGPRIEAAFRKLAGSK